MEVYYLFCPCLPRQKLIFLLRHFQAILYLLLGLELYLYQK